MATTIDRGHPSTGSSAHREGAAGTSAPASAPSRILTAALSVFSARGFRGGSLNDVAATAGLTRAGLLHHFPSKEALLLALLEQRDVELRAAREERRGREPVTLPELAAMALDSYRPFAADRQLMQLAHILTAEASGADHPAHAWVSRRYAWLLDDLGDLVQGCITAGSLPPATDPRAIAALLLGVVEGLENIWLVDPSAPTPTYALECLVGLLATATSSAAPSAAPSSTLSSATPSTTPSTTRSTA